MRVAFIGASGAGKTFASNLCEELFGGNIRSFALPLKLEVFNYLQEVRKGNSGPLLLGNFPDINTMSLPPVTLTHEGLSVQWVNSHKAELRTLLQIWGTDYKRALDDTYWIKQLEPFLDTQDHIYVDDCRYMNEAECLSNKGFQFIGLKRSTEATMSHASELEYRDIIIKYKAPVIQNEDVLDLLSAIEKELNFDSNTTALSSS